MVERRQAEIALTASELGELKGLAARRSTAQALALRARIVLASATGAQHKQVAADLGCDPQTVGKWRRRFLAQRLDGLRDEPRSGAPRTIEDVRVEAVIVADAGERRRVRPTGVRGAWRATAACRSARCSGLARLRLQPHRMETFKLSTDPDFVAKVRDVVGLYLSPPEQRWCCVWTRSRRSRRSTAARPMLPMRPGQPAAAQPRLYAPRTTSLFAALTLPPEASSGVLSAPSRGRVPPLPDEIEANVPASLDVHLVMDNYATHKTDDPRTGWPTAALARSPHADQLAPGSTRSNGSSPDHRQADQARYPPQRRRTPGRDRRFIDQHNAAPSRSDGQIRRSDISPPSSGFCIYNMPPRLILTMRTSGSGHYVGIAAGDIKLQGRGVSRARCPGCTAASVKIVSVETGTGCANGQDG